MKKKLHWLILLFNLSTLMTHAQLDSMQFQVKFKRNDKLISINDTLENEHQAWRIKTLKCYLTIAEPGSPFEASQVHLIDFQKPKSLTFTSPIHQAETLRIQVGVDSLTHTLGVLSGDLDPSIGMYWTWQSGYIQFKMEAITTNQGTASNLEIHLGGYSYPFNTVREVKILPTNNKALTIIEIQLDELINEISKSKVFRVMSPSVTANSYMDILAKSIRIYEE